MREIQRGRKLRHDRLDAIGGHAPATHLANALRQRWARQKLLNHVDNVALDAEMVDLYNIGMAHPRHDPGLALEARHEVIRLAGGAQHLDRYLAIERWIITLIDARHAAAAQQLAHAIVAE